MRGKTVGDVVAEVKMMRSAKKHFSFLIVEGKDDYRFWKSRIGTRCDVIDATCKSVGVGAVRKLNVRDFVGHLGIFDRDYDNVFTRSNSQGNEIYWDAHSLETVLFLSKSFERAVSEHADEPLRNKFETSVGLSARAFVQEVTTLIGAVRYIHKLSGSELDPEVLSPFRHAMTLFDRASILAAGVACGAAPTIAKLQVAIKEYASLDARFLMRGHDVSAVVSLVIVRCGGACSNKQVEQNLRLGFDRTDLESTTVYSEIREWEAVRSPYEIIG